MNVHEKIHTKHTTHLKMDTTGNYNYNMNSENSIYSLILEYDLLPSSHDYPGLPIRRLIVIIIAMMFWQVAFETLLVHKLKYTIPTAIDRIALFHAAFEVFSIIYLCIYYFDIFEPHSMYFVFIDISHIVYVLCVLNMCRIKSTRA